MSRRARSKRSETRDIERREGGRRGDTDVRVREVRRGTGVDGRNAGRCMMMEGDGTCRMMRGQAASVGIVAMRESGREGSGAFTEC